jgi:signal-transduction protein with cAMP-binding, CBS, and nucleotidyltransferase domain
MASGQAVEVEDMVTVQQILRDKGFDVWSIGPDSTVFEAVQMMADRKVGALPVVDWASNMVGIISERDYTRKIVLMDRSSRGTKVREIMTPDVFSVEPDRSVDECMMLMSNHRIRHLPVTEGGRVVGMLSIGDILKTIIAEKQLLIEQLENYISGTG